MIHHSGTCVLNMNRNLFFYCYGKQRRSFSTSSLTSGNGQVLFTAIATFISTWLHHFPSHPMDHSSFHRPFPSITATKKYIYYNGTKSTMSGRLFMITSKQGSVWNATSLTRNTNPQSEKPQDPNVTFIISSWQDNQNTPKPSSQQEQKQNTAQW